VNSRTLEGTIVGARAARLTAETFHAFGLSCRGTYSDALCYHLRRTRRRENYSLSDLAVAPQGLGGSGRAEEAAPGRQCADRPLQGKSPKTSRPQKSGVSPHTIEEQQTHLFCPDRVPRLCPGVRRSRRTGRRTRRTTPDVDWTCICALPR